jgi:hypothetical protein
MTTQAAVGDDVRERVARAIFAAAQEEARKVQPSEPLPSYDDDDDDARQFCLRMADAAIASVPPDVIVQRFIALTSMPCETQGPEDAESGCCAPCRARSLIASVPPVPIDDGWQPDELVSRWQGERHEWFKRDIAEIVEDFAKWLLASLHPNQPGDR